MLSVDEKSQIQGFGSHAADSALESMIPERQTHDYMRHGTTTRLDRAERVERGDAVRLHAPPPRLRHQEFLRFLERIERSTALGLTAPGLTIHLIWITMARTPTLRLKPGCAPTTVITDTFTPTGASWPNLVERFFAEITDKRIRRGTFRSVRSRFRVVLHFGKQKLQDKGA